tara:strand:- start:368 stop:655 length:288 start_codon:yes stop_codon:yes gene_type:complete
LKRKLESIEKNAQRLLKSMGIENLEDALDGPGNPAIYHALAAVEHSSEDMIRQATERISRLIELVEIAEAVFRIERSATAAVGDADSDLTMVTPA